MRACWWRWASWPVRLDAEAGAALGRYDWPGNVRELENVLSRVVLRAAAGVARGEAVVITAADLGSDFAAPPAAAPASDADEHAPARPARSLREATLDFQRAAIRRALRDNDGNWAAAARALGMHRSNLHHLAGRLGLR
jgi:anaerobic nitric oxide reductase transcription regulator